VPDVETSDDALLRSPLHDRHVALGATLGAFGGWSMPLSYPAGTVAEHTAVRSAVGVFDVSHLGKLSVTGPGAAAFVNRCLTADLDRISAGHAQYTLCCADDGGVVDDLIAYLVRRPQTSAGSSRAQAAPRGVVVTADTPSIGGSSALRGIHLDPAITPTTSTAAALGPDEVLLVPNAANAAAVAALLRSAAPEGVEVADRHVDLAVLAVQGPRSFDVLGKVLPGATGGDAPGHLDDLEYMAFVDLPGTGLSDTAHIRVCRTGYTGEHGYELLVPSGDALAVWDALLAAAEPLGGLPCGLAARDTLRTEMGYPLHGQDLSAHITPVQAGSGWAVGWGKPEFWGRDALLAEKETGPVRRLRGLRAAGRGVPRAGMAVLDAAGAQVGVTTSGTFSPTLRTGIALALIDTASGVGIDDAVQVDVRGRSLPCTVVKPPFVPSHVR
jgi:aminomethyltransferase